MALQLLISTRTEEILFNCTQQLILYIIKGGCCPSKGVASSAARAPVKSTRVAFLMCASVPPAAGRDMIHQLHQDNHLHLGRRAPDQPRASTPETSAGGSMRSTPTAWFPLSKTRTRRLARKSSYLRGRLSSMPVVSCRPLRQ